ncbi:MAG: nucleotidyltransferase domain-containing protein [Bacteroidales bacterium]|nr:nucleotidyltransferase domain-containing protein [Bacteroidales bacterium]
MEQHEVIRHIKEKALKILPEGSSLWLYGSRARGDAHDGSDYDLLILLDKDKITSGDYDDYVYAFSILGVNIDEEINPHIYTRRDWEKWSFEPFHSNVEREKIVLR